MVTLLVATASATGPVGDAVADATVIGTLPFTDSQNTTGATEEVGEPLPCGIIGSTVWYEYTPAASGDLTADTFGSGFDTVLAVYTEAPGTLPAIGDLLECNDDFGGRDARVVFPAAAGTTYQFQVGGFDAQQGGVMFNLKEGVGGTISGNVTDEETGALLEDVCVSISGPDFNFELTDALGGFFFSGLPGGDYTVDFSDCINGVYAPEVYDDQPPGSGLGDPVAVNLGVDTTDIDAELAF